MLHLKTFGGLSVDIDGSPGTGAAQQRKTLGLLALLAAAGQRGLSRDKLIASLWPETDAEHGRDSSGRPATPSAVISRRPTSSSDRSSSASIPP